MLIKGVIFSVPAKRNGSGQWMYDWTRSRIDGVRIGDPTWGSPAYTRLQQWSIDPHRLVTPDELFSRYFAKIDDRSGPPSSGGYYYVVYNTDGRSSLRDSWQFDRTAESNLAVYPYGYGDACVEPDGNICIDEG